MIMFKLSILIGALGVGMLLSGLAWPAGNQNSTAATAQSVAYGRALFSAKGCAQCHHHAQIPQSGRFSGGDGPGSAPDLTHHPLPAEYLHSWLKDPKSIKPDTTMPNLALKKEEIEALIAFLQTPAPAS